MSGPRVVCIGGAVLDRKLRLLEEAVPATSNPARGTTSFGGVARNVADNLARLGVAAALISAVGDDVAGRALRLDLRGRGVDVRGLVRIPGVPTAQYVAVLSPGGDLVLGVADMDVLECLDVDQIRRAWPRTAQPGVGMPHDWVLADCNLTTEVLAEILELACSTGVPLVLDAVSTAKVTRLPALLGGVAVLVCNLDEARAWVGRHGGPRDGDPEELAQRLLGAGATNVVLTRGAAGVVLANADGVRDQAAEPARVVDVTGAGDALVAGVLAALVSGKGLDDAVRWGMSAASLTVESQDSVRPDLCARLLEERRASADQKDHQ